MLSWEAVLGQVLPFLAWQSCGYHILGAHCGPCIRWLGLRKGTESTLCGTGEWLQPWLHRVAGQSYVNTETRQHLEQEGFAVDTQENGILNQYPARPARAEPGAGGGQNRVQSSAHGWTWEEPCFVHKEPLPSSGGPLRKGQCPGMSFRKTFSSLSCPFQLGKQDLIQWKNKNIEKVEWEKQPEWRMTEHLSPACVSGDLKRLLGRGAIPVTSPEEQGERGSGEGTA